jgi:hypothetical protein
MMAALAPRVGRSEMRNTLAKVFLTSTAESGSPLSLRDSVFNVRQVQIRSRRMIRESLLFFLRFSFR